jgi:hypothetical protein
MQQSFQLYLVEKISPPAPRIKPLMRLCQRGLQEEQERGFIPSTILAGFGIGLGCMRLLGWQFGVDYCGDGG